MKGGLAADSQALRAAISAAGVAGQLFVAAAGNDYGTNIDLDGGTPTFPVRSFFSLSPSLSRLRGKKTSEEKKKQIFFPSPPPPPVTPPRPPPPPPKKKKRRATTPRPSSRSSPPTGPARGSPTSPTGAPRPQPSRRPGKGSSRPSPAMITRTTAAAEETTRSTTGPPRPRRRSPGPRRCCWRPGDRRGTRGRGRPTSATTCCFPRGGSIL